MNTSTETPYNGSESPTVRTLPYGVNIFLGVSSLGLLPVIVIGNSLVISAMILYRRRLNTPTNVFIGSLSFADLSVGLMTLPMYAFHYFSASEFVRYKYLCILKYSSILFSLSSSMYSLTAIAVDRYIAILHPLKYPVWMTSSMSRKISCGIYIYNFLVMCIPYIWHNDTILSQKCDFYTGLPMVYTIVFSFGSIFLLLFTCLVLYVRVFRVVLVNRKKTIERKAQKDYTKRQQIKKETKSASTMGTILFLFVAFWFPFLVSGPLKYTRLSPEIVDLIKNICLLIAQSNSAVNPILYCWLKPDFAWAFKQMLPCCCGSTDTPGHCNKIPKIQTVELSHSSGQRTNSM